MTIHKATYWKKISLLDSFFTKKLYENRIKINNIIKRFINIDQSSLILDVGTAPSLKDFENVFIHQIEYKENLTSISNVDCSILKKKFSKIRFLIGDGLNLKLPSNTYDIVHSSATIEHVGSENDQIKFIKECLRVSKKFTVITTPNRNFFLDFHTKIPFIHMLPKSLHRKILKISGDNFFSEEKNLNLINAKDIKKFCKNLGIKNYKIIFHNFMFMRSNIILIINKN
jgi:SAM-dependent methyltransferase